MAKTTTNLGLYEAESTDSTNTFNITTMLNENWDKIDAGVAKKTEIPTIPTSLPANGGNSTTVNNHTAAATPNTTEQIDLVGMVSEVNSNLTSHEAENETQFSTVNSKISDIKYLPNTGIANAILVNKTGFTLANGSYVEWQQTEANTGVVTINATSTGVKDLRNTDGTVLASGDLEVGFYKAIYDSVQGFFVLAPRNGAKITGQVEAVVNYYENINKGDLVTTRRYFGFDTPLNVAAPNIAPTGDAWGVAFSPDDIYLAVAHAVSPFVTIYKRNGDTFTKLANPTTLPGYANNGVAFSPDGKYLAVACTTAGGLTLYKRNGDIFTKLTDPTTLPPGSSTDITFSPNGKYLVVSHQVSPYVTIYKVDNTTDTFTKLANPASLPAAGSNGASFSEDSNYLAVVNTSTSPYVAIYKVDNDTDTFTKLANPDVLPSPSYNVAFSPDGKYLAIIATVTPFLYIYKRNGDTFTKLANPTTLPTAPGYGIAFSPDGKYLAVTVSISPYIISYKVDSSTDTFTKLANPTTLPLNSTRKVAFANLNAYMAVTNVTTTPYITIYKADILGDFAHKYTSINDLYRANYINFGYAKSTDVASATNKKIVTLPIK